MVLPSAHKIVKLLAPPRESFDFYVGTEETRRNNISLKTLISFQMNRFSEKENWEASLERCEVKLSPAGVIFPFIASSSLISSGSSHLFLHSISFSPRRQFFLEKLRARVKTVYPKRCDGGGSSNYAKFAPRNYCSQSTPHFCREDFLNWEVGARIKRTDSKRKSKESRLLDQVETRARCQ